MRLGEQLHGLDKSSFRGGDGAAVHFSEQQPIAAPAKGAEGLGDTKVIGEKQV